MSATRRVVTDFSSIASKYLDDVLKDIPGMKALLMDEDTMKVVSNTYNQSQLLNYEVVLVESLGKIDRKTMNFLTAVVVIRPSAESHRALCNEVATGNFKDYHIVYTNIIESDQLTGLGQADRRLAVKSVQEVFLDVVPVTDQCCIVPLKPPAGATLSLSELTSTRPWNPVFPDEWDASELIRAVQGMTAMMLMGKRRPAIRYRAGSRLSEKLVMELSNKMRSLRYSFPDLPDRDSVFLILDRRDDPITPLLTPWTYEAMIHEFLGIFDGKVTVESEEVALERAKKERELLEERAEKGEVEPEELDKPLAIRPIEERVLVLSKQYDHFFAEHRSKNFGEACSGIQKVVDSYKTAAKASDMKTATLEDLKKFVRDGSKVRQQSAVATRHTEILTILDGIVRKRNLLELSLLEQEIAVKDNHAQHMTTLREHLGNVAFNPEDLLRVVMLYALRYQSDPANCTAEFKKTLETKRNLNKNKVALIDRMLDYAGGRARIGDCFHPNQGAGLVGQSVAFVKAMAGFDSSDSNARSVYTQHEPWLKYIVNSVYYDTLPQEHYPYQRVGSNTNPAGSPGANPAQSESYELYQPKNIFVFVIGGLTYEEALFVERVNNGEVIGKPPANTSPLSLADRFRGGESKEEKIDAKLFVCSPSMLNSEEFLSVLGRADTK